MLQRVHQVTLRAFLRPAPIEGKFSSLLIIGDLRKIVCRNYNYNIIIHNIKNDETKKRRNDETIIASRIIVALKDIHIIKPWVAAQLV